MLLETRSDAAPFPDDAFLVVDSDLTVQALSHQAQRLLGKTEHDVIDWPITYFLGPADAENGEIGGFMNLLHDATMGSEDLQSVCVRPLGAFGVRVVARIAPCGPPRAALVVLSTQMPRLDLRIVRPRASTLPA
jgi:PAS domain-containing protein